MQPCPTDSVHHHHRIRMKELLVLRGGHRKCFRTRPGSALTVHRHDVHAKGRVFARRYHAELSQYCRKVSSVCHRYGWLTSSSRRQPLCPQATEPVFQCQTSLAKHANYVRQRVYSSVLWTAGCIARSLSLWSAEFLDRLHAAVSSRLH
jgi:hypothetical protein